MFQHELLKAGLIFSRNSVELNVWNGKGWWGLLEGLLTLAAGDLLLLAVDLLLLGGWLLLRGLYCWWSRSIVPGEIFCFWLQGIYCTHFVVIMNTFHTNYSAPQNYTWFCYRQKGWYGVVEPWDSALRQRQGLANLMAE